MKADRRVLQPGLSRSVVSPSHPHIPGTGRASVDTSAPSPGIDALNISRGKGQRNKQEFEEAMGVSR